MIKSILLALLFCVLSPMAAFAQCSPQTGGGYPFNCVNGGSPQATDIIGGGSNNGSLKGDSVYFTVDALTRYDHSNSPVTATNGPAKSLADWMAQLQSLGSGNGGGGGGGTGTVNTGGGGALAYYASSGAVISPLTMIPLGVLTTDANSQPLVSTSLPSGLTIPNPKFTGTITGLPSGAGSGTVNSSNTNYLAYYAATGSAISGLTTANSSVLVTNASGVPSFATTMPSGLTYPNPTFTGTITGLPSGGGGSGTVNNGSANYLAYYAATGTSVSPLATSNNAVLLTSSTGSPAFGSTLPPALVIPQPTLQGPIVFNGTGSATGNGDYADFAVNAVGGSTPATQIITALSGCANCYQRDAMRTVMTVPSGSTETNADGFASYILDNMVSQNNGRNAVNFFGANVANVNGAQIWGINTNLNDASFTGLAQNNLTGRVLANEYDFNVSSNQTKVYGAVFQGNSVVQPSSSTALLVSPLRLATGQWPWDQAFYSGNGAATVAMFVGTNGAPVNYNNSQPVSNLTSQPIAFITTNGSGTQQVSQLLANGAGFQFTTAVQSPSVVIQNPFSPNDNDACVAGQFTWDGNYIYVCIASGHWMRANLNNY